MIDSTATFSTNKCGWVKISCLNQDSICLKGLRWWKKKNENRRSIVLPCNSGSRGGIWNRQAQKNKLRQQPVSNQQRMVVNLAKVAIDVSIDHPFKLSGQVFPGSGILREVFANDTVHETCDLLRHHYCAERSTRLAPSSEAARQHEP